MQRTENASYVFRHTFQSFNVRVVPNHMQISRTPSLGKPFNNGLVFSAVEPIVCPRTSVPLHAYFLFSQVYPDVNISEHKNNEQLHFCYVYFTSSSLHADLPVFLPLNFALMNAFGEVDVLLIV